MIIESKIRKNAVFCVLFCAITLIMTVRAFYGIEITDEAYYLAEGRTVLEGNVPYVLNNSNTVGMTFVMLPFVWLFRLFSPDYAGYFIYMRICYVLFKSLVVLAGFFIVKKRTGFFYAACMALYMDSFQMRSILDFSYNTISSILIFLAGLILYAAAYGTDKKRSWYYTAGIISAIAVLAHPAHAVSVVLFLVLLIVFGPDRREVPVYIAGGLTPVTVLVITISLRNGFMDLFRGIIGYGNNLDGMEKPSFVYVLNEIWSSFEHLWMIVSVSFVLCCVFIILSKKRYKNDSLLSVAKETVRTEALDSLCFSAIIGLGYVFLRGSQKDSAALAGACATFAVLVLIIRFPKNRGVWFTGVPAVMFSFFEAFTTTGSPAGRFVHAVPAFVSLFILLGENRKEIDPVRKFILPALTVAAIAVVEINGLRYVYEEEPLPELTCAVPGGVYKGIMTTPQKAADITEFEEFIKSITGPDDHIAFRDNVPAGYLVMNGKICDIRTWDCMQYTYGRNDPSGLYAYYDRAGRTPDKIIYVDYGRDEKLSLDDSSFLYNDFVNENYDRVSDTGLNDTFKRIVLYKRSEK